MSDRLRLLSTEDRIDLLNNMDLGYLYVDVNNKLFELIPEGVPIGGLYSKSRVYRAIDTNGKLVTKVTISVKTGYLNDTVDTWKIYRRTDYTPRTQHMPYADSASSGLSLYTAPKPVYTAVRNLKAVNEWRRSQGLEPLTSLQAGQGRKSHRKHRNKKRRRTRHRVGQ
jgi:hypothetical protein